MRRLILAAVLLAAPPALADTPAPPPPLVQACAQEASQQMQSVIVWHAQVITDAQEIAALKAQVAKLTVPPPAAPETKP